MEIERELIRRGLGHEVGPVFKILDFVKLQFHQVVNGFDIGLHAMRSRVDGVVELSRERFDGSRVGRGGLGVPGADVFAAVIGLPDGFLGKSLVFLQEMVDVRSKHLGVGQRDAFGKAQEEYPAGDLAEGVLNLREVACLGLKIVFGNIHEVLGVLHGLLEEFKLFLHGPQIVLGDMFLGSLARGDLGLLPDLTHGFRGERQFFKDPDLSGADTLVFGLELNDMVFDMLGSRFGGIVRFVRAILKAGVSVSLKAVEPFSDDWRAGIKVSCRRLDAFCEGVLDHLITPLFFVFALSHNLAILVWAHACLEPPLILTGF